MYDMTREWELERKLRDVKKSLVRAKGLLMTAVDLIAEVEQPGYDHRARCKNFARNALKHLKEMD
jgi:hypothetical protein